MLRAGGGCSLLAGCVENIPAWLESQWCPGPIIDYGGTWHDRSAHFGCGML